MDPDSGAGGIVSYSITDATPRDAMMNFNISSRTGAIMLMQTLDRETTSLITLRVAAQDMGVPGKLTNESAECVQTFTVQPPLSLSSPLLSSLSPSPLLSPSLSSPLSLPLLSSLPPLMHTVLSSVVSVQITVSDVNDNPPEFAQSFYSTSVSESLPTGASAFQVHFIQSPFHTLLHTKTITSHKERTVLLIHFYTQYLPFPLSTDPHFLSLSFTHTGDS